MTTNPFINRVERNTNPAFYAVLNSGGVLCRSCVIGEQHLILEATENYLQSGWDQSGYFVLNIEENTEDYGLRCSHCSDLIPRNKG